MLPWQLRHTFYFANLGGNYFEYTSIHLYATDLLIFILLGLWFIRRPKVSLPNRLVWRPLLLWLTWITVSSWYGMDWGNSLQQAIHYWLMFGWVIYLFNNIRDWCQVLWPLVLGAVFQAVWGIGQFLVNHDLGMQILGESPLSPDQGGVAVVGDEARRQIRAEGMLPHPNILGGLMAFTVIPLGALYNSATRKQKSFLFLFAVLVGIGLVLSFSRMSWVVALVVLLTVVIVGFWRTKRWVWVPLIAVTFGILVTATWQWSNITERFSTESRLEQKSVEDRVESIGDWKQVLAGNEIFGVGTGNYTQALVKIEPNQLAWVYKPIHNIYLLLIAENGVVGFGIWIWFVLAVIWLWVGVIRRNPAEWWVGMPLVGILTIGLVDHWAVSFQQGRLLFFLALALIILESRVLLERQK